MNKASNDANATRERVERREGVQPVGRIKCQGREGKEMLTYQAGVSKERPVA